MSGGAVECPHCLKRHAVFGMNLTLQLCEDRPTVLLSNEGHATPRKPATGYRAFNSRKKRRSTMWIPTKLYETLPIIYVMTGVSIILCALYIGISDGPMLGYLVLGSGCIMAGILVKTIRSNARLEADQPQA
jgi:hypothetical protein